MLSSKILISTLFPIALAVPLTPLNSSFDWATTTSLLAFGDSYTYVQGTQGLQNYSFIEDAFNYSYTSAQLLSDEIVQNQIGTSAGGPNWVEYLTGCYEGLPSQCNDFVGGQKELWDFAFAGADISTTYLPLHHNYSVDLDSQVRQWDQYARPFLPVNISNGLAAFYIGINDVSDSDHNTTVISFPDFYASLVSTLFESVETVYSGGYRSFLFMNLPPLERTPGNVVAASQGQPLSPNVTQVQQYNDALAAGVAGFGSKHADVDAMLFDVHTFLNGVIDNGEEYGLKNVTGYCPNYDAPDIATNYAAYGCIPIPEYFWYNTGHITFRVHQILAGAVEDFLAAMSAKRRGR